MPPFLLISASAYLAPSTSLCASAERTPVSGLTMPILIGSSASDLTMKGDENCAAAIAAPDLSKVRRSTDQMRFEIPMISSRACVLWAAFCDALIGGERNPSRLPLPTISRCDLRPRPAHEAVNGRYFWPRFWRLRC